MITSDFSLEYTILPDFTKGKPNIPREPMPIQLSRLGILKMQWMQVYDKTSNVVENQLLRNKEINETNAKAAKSSLSLNFSTKKKQDEKDQIILARKADNEKAALEEWSAIIVECSNNFGQKGISAKVMIEQKTGMRYGILFRCLNSPNLGVNKLELRYDRRRIAWTWAHDKVPDELAAMHVDLKSWAFICNEARAVMGRQLGREKNKRMLDNSIFRMNEQESNSDRKGVSQIMKLQAKIAQEDFAIEKDWKILAQIAEDTFFLRGISTSLLVDHRVPNAMYSGLIFRFQQTVCSAPIEPLPVTAVPILLPTAPVVNTSIQNTDIDEQQTAGSD